MGTRRQRVRLLGSVLLAFSSIAACVGRMPEGDAKDASAMSGASSSELSQVNAKKGEGGAKTKPRADAPVAARKQDEARSAAEPRSAAELRSPLAASEIHCPHGLLQDPHRGFVRCLRAEEQGAKWLPPAPQAPPVASATPGAPASPAGSGSSPAPAPSSTGASPTSPAFVVPASVVTTPPLGPDAAPAAAAPASSEPPALEVKGFTFENGEVPHAEKAITKLAAEMGKCVVKNGGLQRSSGSMKVQFIVRARGRAEGVEILSSQGVSAEASACVRVLLKNRAIGEPSSDPVGVTFILSLKPAGK